MADGDFLNGLNMDAVATSMALLTRAEVRLRRRLRNRPLTPQSIPLGFPLERTWLFELESSVPGL